MNGPGLPGDPALRMRTMQIILGGLISSVVMFGAIVVYLHTTNQAPPPQETRIVSGTSLGFAGMCVLIALIFPTILEPTWQRQAPTETGGTLPLAEGQLSAVELYWWRLYQTRMIVRGALLEGSCFILLIAFLLERQTWTLITAIAVLVLLACTFPTMHGVMEWVERQRKQAQGLG
jgi:hypothetical protein